MQPTEMKFQGNKSKSMTGPNECQDWFTQACECTGRTTTRGQYGMIVLTTPDSANIVFSE